MQAWAAWGLRASRPVLQFLQRSQDGAPKPDAELQVASFQDLSRSVDAEAPSRASCWSCGRAFTCLSKSIGSPSLWVRAKAVVKPQNHQDHLQSTVSVLLIQRPKGTVATCVTSIFSHSFRRQTCGSPEVKRTQTSLLLLSVLTILPIVIVHRSSDKS